MKTLQRLAQEGWTIGIQWQPGGYYVEISQSGVRYSGYSETLPLAIADLLHWMHMDKVVNS